MIGWRVARRRAIPTQEMTDRPTGEAKVRLEMEDVNLIGRQGCMEYRERRRGRRLDGGAS